ncbi:MAG: tRNA (adenosine(37)-N6)-threonylcarbamoyltransferase complex ATPase subunit type 1 TsaE [Cyclobacteriaceae bacterium]
MSMIHDLADLSNFAKEITERIKNNPVVVFYGEMGAGKTTLIKMICENFGVQDEMSSPTFSLVNEYLGGDGEPIYHFDLYRLETLKEAMDIGIEEYLFSGNICFIEWPQIIEEELPDQYLKISIKLVDENKRQITVLNHD